MEVYDVAIVGGGIVGLATAMALAESSPAQLVVLEAEDRIAAHQTGHNSGVIHSGLYYKPGSLKARNCVEGRELLYRFCQEHGIPFERCGKLVVATRPTELPALEELERRGRANGLAAMRRMDPDEIRRREPHAGGIAGLLVPETGIVDFAQVAAQFARIVQARGGQLRMGHAVRNVFRQQGSLILETTRGEIRARHLIGCAGLQADRIARLCGLEPGLSIVPFRGEYYQLRSQRRHLVRHLIYPVPDARFPFLGVHFTRRIDGTVEAGPNAVLTLARHGYRWTNVSLRDCWHLLKYRGFWRMAARYWRTGCEELYRSLSKQAFVGSLRRLLPELRRDDLVAGGSGVRAQAVEPDGTLVDDFRLLEAERMIHLLNAPSPAATASISIGRMIAARAIANFDVPRHNA
jgi:L-2-hydroxyglutarate oxidase